ncbi:hypothetical protein CAN33_0048455 [Aspergillus niger]|uniref:Uncharacterized protein n=1 Tax=Aspergillus niger TaxID=5061 RepID=A0A505IDI8_ASPNG|nr:hypothetical protein CAN33_0048455 [Aspergillus niger]
MATQEQTLPSFRKQRKGFLKRIGFSGVIYDDASWRNVLWNEEKDGLVVNDFESPPQKKNKPCNGDNEVSVASDATLATKVFHTTYCKSSWGLWIHDDA